MTRIILIPCLPAVTRFGICCNGSIRVTPSAMLVGRTSGAALWKSVNRNWLSTLKTMDLWLAPPGWHHMKDHGNQYGSAFAKLQSVIQTSPHKSDGVNRPGIQFSGLHLMEDMTVGRSGMKIWKTPCAKAFQVLGSILHTRHANESQSWPNSTAHEKNSYGPNWARPRLPVLWNTWAYWLKLLPMPCPPELLKTLQQLTVIQDGRLMMLFYVSWLV